MAAAPTLASITTSSSSSSSSTSSATHILVLGATGRVGRHVVQALVTGLFSSTQMQQQQGRVVIHAATRDPTSAAAQSLLHLVPASTTVPSPVSVVLLPLDLAVASIAELETACHGKRLLFLVMPQAFSPKDMLRCQTQLAAALARTRPRCLVKLSSFGIDSNSSRCVMTQGPLGEAHQQGEAALRAAGIPLLVSLRPSSFFENFDAYDLPGLRDGARCLRSPLGRTARVNWVACEDVGAAGAALLLQSLSRGEEEAAAGGFEVIDVLGPEANTVSGPGLAALVTRALGETVRYEEAPLPADENYGPLWAFLREGGFDAFSSAAAASDVWMEMVGRPSLKLEDHVRAALT